MKEHCSTVEWDEFSLSSKHDTKHNNYTKMLFINLCYYRLFFKCFITQYPRLLRVWTRECKAWQRPLSKWVAKRLNLTCYWLHTRCLRKVKLAKFKFLIHNRDPINEILLNPAIPNAQGKRNGRSLADSRWLNGKSTGNGCKSSKYNRDFKKSCSD